MVFRSARYRVQVFSEHSEAKIRNARMTRVVHEDICLAGCEYNDEVK